MKDGLAALTKFVKVVMSYRPDRDSDKVKPQRKRPPKRTKPKQAPV